MFLPGTNNEKPDLNKQLLSIPVIDLA